jgi:hypothetical protein
MILSSHYLITVLHVAHLRMTAASFAVIESYLIHQGYYNVHVDADHAEALFDGVLYEF